MKEEQPMKMKTFLTLLSGVVLFSFGTAAALAQDEEEKQDDSQKQEEFSHEDAEQLFEKCYKLHEGKKYVEAIAGFKKIFDHFPDDSLGYTSAYNIACGYALLGKKDKALDWLETAVKHGFKKFDHMENDTDLDSLRDEPRYKKIIEEGGEEE